MSTALVRSDFNHEEQALIQKQFFPAGATQTEQQYCFAVAKELNLNPITREIYFVPRRAKVGDKWVNRVEPMVGRDGFLAIAHRTGQLAGMETTVTIRQVPQLESGTWTARPQLVADCTVWRKDSSKPFSVQVSYNEYVQKTSDGQPTKFWAEKPETMLKKVAESQALRKAFNVCGVYSPEELDAGYETAAGEIITPEPVSHLALVPPQQERQLIHPGQESQGQIIPPPSETPLPPSPPPIIDADEEGWPVGMPPAPHEAGQQSDNAILQELVGLLEAKDVPYSLDMQAGVISAKSFNHKELLKSSGFKWNPDVKMWQFLFEPDPF